MNDLDLLILVSKVFAFLVCVVGGYVYMFLHVMRSDPREEEFRKHSNQSTGLLPKKRK